jgi:D-alanyl-D-alanine carboxypeptidase (penicillin-binding protein 5/6)
MAERKKKKKGGAVVTLIILLIVIAMLAVMILKGTVLDGIFGGSSSGAVTAASSDGGFQMHFVGTTSGDGVGESVSSSSAAAAKSADVQQLSSYNVHSDNALMVRLSDGAVFFDKASTEKMYPASMTKIMTCIIALEKIPDINSQMTIYQEDIDAHFKEGASRAGFEANETVPVKDVLYGMMLPSGAECCVAICRQVAGSEAAFVDLMNQKAKEIGMDNTNFTNSIGLHDDNHYSTCADFIKLEEYALKNDTFRQIFTTRDYTTTPTEQHPSGISFTNNCFKHLSTINLPNGALFEGGKTGYTAAALQTLASIAKYGDDEYIMVTAHGGGAAHANIDDAVTLYGRLGTDEVAGTEPTETPTPAATDAAADPNAAATDAAAADPNAAAN